MPRVLAVSVGRPQDKEWAGIGRTSIDKGNLTGPVVVHALGIEGDEVSDTEHHGGPHQAVYAYAREDLDFWEAELGQPIRNGQFGENLTTEGLDLTSMEIGTRLRIGGADGPLLEVAHVRTPCNDFKGWMGESGYDPTVWVKRFTAEARPGPYLRVLQPGTLAAGDPVEVVHRPGHGVTVRDMFVALNTDRNRLPELAAIELLPPKVREKVEEFVRAAGVPYPLAAE
ncbi:MULTISPECIES: MOSC domain-containing protein [unclassified Nocardioides]|uniref:MOSC domain-containing protein n=1 Tax=unclassified Nocardioides TaxID=2615069 RepID=UPI0006F55B8A|nr:MULTISPECIES: MOSC domain-containing protein [unclassified Nocardioides]KRA29448.1 sulfurase [Nocardioides sp. Root614]KRA88377.1 sulfurase [Nocardioides sp. Root682]